MVRRVSVYLLVSLAASAVCGQIVTGELSGSVASPDGNVIPGAVVEVTGDQLLRVRHAVSDERGRFRVANLPPGHYDLQVQVDGFKVLRSEQVRVVVGGTTTLDLELELGAVSEQVVVRAETPLIDRESAKVGTVYSGDWLALAPTARGGGAYEALAQTPGVVVSFTGSRSLQSFGSSRDENSFQLDGAETNDSFLGTPSGTVSDETIAEVEVLSLGAPAEYGNLAGAVVNIVTRQGTNQLKGTVASFYTEDQWISRNTTEEVDDGHPWTLHVLDDRTVSLGGPVLRDKLWYFATFEDNRVERSGVGVPQDIGRSELDVRTGFAKFNFQAGASHRLDATFHRDKTNFLAGKVPQWVDTTDYGALYDVPTYVLAYTGVLTSQTTLEARYTGFDLDDEVLPVDPNEPLDLPLTVNLGTGQLTGPGNVAWWDEESKRNSLSVKSSHNSETYLRGVGHEFRFGVQYTDTEAAGIWGPNPILYDFGGPYGYGYYRPPVNYAAGTDGWGAFLDDRMVVGDRLTLQAGVRFDVTSAFSPRVRELDAHLQPTGRQFDRVEHFQWEHVSPRLGFDWILDEEGKSSLSGHLGRYHRPVITGEYAVVVGPHVTPSFVGLYSFLNSEFVAVIQQSDNSNLSIDSGYDGPYQDQVGLSFERQLGKHSVLSLHASHKRGRDYPAWRDTAGIYETVTWIDGDYDLDGQVDPGVDPHATGRPIALQRLISDPGERAFMITNRPEMNRETTGVSLVFRRRLANRWQLQSSLTHQETEGRSTDSGFSSSLNQTGGLQFSTFGQNPNDFVNTYGPLRSDVPLQFKLSGSYRLPFDIELAASYFYRDGATRVRRVVAPVALTQVLAVINAEPRGALGRFPDQSALDVKIQRAFHLGRADLVLSVDVFNVFNEGQPSTTRSSFSTSALYDKPAGYPRPRGFLFGARIRF